MKLFYTLLMGTALSTPAWALDVCKVSDQDPQVRICVYSPQQRYVITGVVGFPVNLEFAETERIKRTEFAYNGVDKDGKPTQTWRGPAEKKPDDPTPLTKDRFKTNLPVWPFYQGHSALVVVTQTEDGTERPYHFDLTAHKAGDCSVSENDPGCVGDTRTTSAISFTYPADQAAQASKEAKAKKEAAIAAWQSRQTAKKEADGIARLKTDVFYGGRNWSYQAKAEKKYSYLAPSQVSDNGWLTEFQWDENIQMPSITIIDPATGDERIAPVSQQGRMVIVNTTSEWFRLRLGKDAVMDIHNLKWSPSRPDPGTGTTSPDVFRSVTYRDGK